jgi:type II secretory pathway pseudopilin PulG
MVKRSFTLIEAIFVIVVLSFVLIGGFQIISKLYERNFIAKKTADFEFTSQQILDELSRRLYYRVPLSVIGYDGSGGFEYIGFITNPNRYKILEWIGYESDAMKEENLSGFIDLYASDKNNKLIKCLDFNYDFIQGVVNNKFGFKKDLNESGAIVFAGSFDRGEEDILSDYNDSFGWHGNEHNSVYTFEKNSTLNNDSFLKLHITSGDIYEKFYLVDSAYAVARGEDINTSSPCIKELNISNKDINDTLFLFYNYRPWLKETFCADKYGNPEGNVTVLGFNVKAFRVKKVNSHLELKITLNKSKADINITVSKQKVTF